MPVELLEHLATSGALEQPGLAALVRTCQRLCSILRPILYSYIELHSRQQAQRLRDRLAEDLPPAKLIKHLVFKYNEDECADADATFFLQRVPNLTSLNIECGESEEDLRQQSGGDMTQENADFLDVYWPSDTSSPRRRNRVHSSLEHCTFVYISGTHPWDITEKILFLTEPTLKSLTLRNCWSTDDNHGALRRNIRYLHPDVQTEGGVKELSLLRCQIEAAAFCQILLFPRALTRLSLVYTELDYDWTSEVARRRDGVKYFQGVKQHIETLEQLLVLGVTTDSNAAEKPCFLMFPRLSQLRTSTAFLGHGDLSKEECRSHDWSDVVPRHTKNSTIIASRACPEDMLGWYSNLDWGNLDPWK